MSEEALDEYEKVSEVPIEYKSSHIGELNISWDALIKAQKIDCEDYYQNNPDGINFFNENFSRVIQRLGWNVPEALKELLDQDLHSFTKSGSIKLNVSQNPTKNFTEEDYKQSHGGFLNSLNNDTATHLLELLLIRNETTNKSFLETLIEFLGEVARLKTKLNIARQNGLSIKINGEGLSEKELLSKIIGPITQELETYLEISKQGAPSKSVYEDERDLTEAVQKIKCEKGETEKITQENIAEAISVGDKFLDARQVRKKISRLEKSRPKM